MFLFIPYNSKKLPSRKQMQWMRTMLVTLYGKINDNKQEATN